MENFRRAIGLRIKETKEVYEGEVTELSPVETENPMGGKYCMRMNRYAFRGSKCHFVFCFPSQWVANSKGKSLLL